MPRGGNSVEHCLMSDVVGVEQDIAFFDQNIHKGSEEFVKKMRGMFGKMHSRKAVALEDVLVELWQVAMDVVGKRA